MSRASWFQQLKSLINNRKRRRRNMVRRAGPGSAPLRFEALENRAVLAVMFDWVNVLGTANYDAATSVAMDSSGNLYESGSTGDRMVLRKLDSTGNVLWTSSIGTNSRNLQRVVVDAQDQVYVTGQINLDPSDMYVARINPANGDAVWTRTMGGTGNDSAQNLVADGMGSVYVVGAFRGTANFGGGWSLSVPSGADINGYIAKLDAGDGHTQWAYRAGINATSVAVDSSGSVFVGAQIRDPNESYFGGSSNAMTLAHYSGNDAALAKYDPAGGLIWAKSWAGTAYYENVSALAAGADGSLAVTLIIGGNGGGNVNLNPNDHSTLPVHAAATNVAVCKLDSDGEFLWGAQQNVLSWPDFHVSGANGVALDASGQVYVASYARTAIGPEDWDSRIAKFDGATGVPLWTEVFGGASSDTRTNGILVDQQGHIYVAGNFTKTTDFDPGPGTQFRTSVGSNDAYLLRLSQALTDQTIIFEPLFDKTYGDAGFIVNATATSGLPVTFTATGDATVSDDDGDGLWYVHITGAGSASITAHQAGNDIYTAAPDVTQSFNIAKADPTVTLNNYSGTYDGQSHLASVIITGVGSDGVLASNSVNRTNAGSDSTTASISGLQNYNDVSGTATINIAKADATVSISGYSITYDGAAHIATGAATGALGESLAGLNLSGTTHTNAGSYTDLWTFIDETGNYNDAIGTVTDSIAKADPTVTLNNYSGAYDGQSHLASVIITGVGSDGVLVSNSVNRTNAGSDSATASISGLLNYNDTSGIATIDIAKADAVISVAGYSVTYDGAAHSATGTATGVLGESLAGLNLAGTTHTNAGSYTDSWTFTDPTGNYNDEFDTVIDIIAKANAAISVTGYNVPDDGNPHTATGSASGVNGEPLAGLDLSGTTHTSPGVYSDPWVFTDATGNYNDASGTVVDTINNLTPTVQITDVTQPNTLFILAGDELTFSGTFSDPGTPDTYTVVWDFGDGTSVVQSVGPGGSENVSANHAYAVSGEYVVLLTVTDSFGAVGVYSRTVVVQSPDQAAQPMIEYIDSLPQLNEGQQNGLIVTLNAAIRAIEDDRVTPARNQLEAFIHRIVALQKSGNLDEATADALIDDAEALKASL